MCIQATKYGYVKLVIFDHIGVDSLLNVIFENIKNKPLGSPSFTNWANHFDKNCIGEYLTFKENKKENSLEFYCSWKKERIAKIVYMS